MSSPDITEMVHLVIEPPVTDKQLAAIRLFAQMILKKGYTPAMLGDVLMAMPPKEPLCGVQDGGAS